MCLPEKCIFIQLYFIYILGLPYLQKQNSGQCMTTFHETKYMRYHILSDKIGNASATHKKFLPVTLHTNEITSPDI